MSNQSIDTTRFIHQVDCIIPAAGLSSRMGEWKMVLPYGDNTIIDASVANALEFCQRVILVTGYRGDELATHYADHKRVTVVHNPDYKSGLFSSIQRGCAKTQTDHIFICHGDIPTLQYDIFDAIWQHRSVRPVLPTYQGQTGHPVLFSKLISTQVLAESIDMSRPAQMRDLLFKHNPNKLALDFPAITNDVDTPAAYQRLLAQ